MTSDVDQDEAPTTAIAVRPNLEPRGPSDRAAESSHLSILSGLNARLRRLRLRRGPMTAVTLVVLLAAALMAAWPRVTTTSLWPADATPIVAAADNGAPVEVGTRFVAAQAGSVIAIRFYKGPGNDGLHIGSLWSADGTKLASVTFVDESATGWQEATFSQPVPMKAGQTFIASYFAPRGHYAIDVPYFDVARDVGPLIAPGTDGAPNGVYAFSPTSTFPAEGFGANYWVDVVYRSTQPLVKARTVRVMTLGDSITEGAGSPGGYRPRLWTRLVDSGRTHLDFVGSLREGPDRFVDSDHEGHSGWTIDRISDQIDGWMEAKPDVILLHVGTNDINSGASGLDAAARLDTLLDKIVKDAPRAHIVVAQIIPLQNEYRDAGTAYDAAIPSVVQRHRERGDQIDLVDMQNVLDPTTDYTDDLHPDEAGYDKMADAWYSSAASAYDAVAG